MSTNYCADKQVVTSFHETGPHGRFVDDGGDQRRTNFDVRKELIYDVAVSHMDAPSDMPMGGIRATNHGGGLCLAIGMVWSAR